MKTNYEELFEEKMQNPEFQIKYIFAKEKLEIELLIDSIKESIKLNKPATTTMKRINKLEKHIELLSV